MIKKSIWVCCVVLSCIMMLVMIYHSQSTIKIQKVWDENIGEIDESIGIAYVANDTEVMIEFVTENQDIEEIELFFHVFDRYEGEHKKNREDLGKLKYSLTNEDGENMGEGTVSVNEIKLQSEKESGYLFPVKGENKRKQILTLNIAGSDIKEGVFVQLLGNKNKISKGIMVKNGSQYGDAPLYSLKIYENEKIDFTNSMLIFIFLVSTAIFIRPQKKEVK